MTCLDLMTSSCHPCQRAIIHVFLLFTFVEVPYCVIDDIKKLKRISHGGGGLIYKGEHEDFGSVFCNFAKIRMISEKS